MNYRTILEKLDNDINNTAHINGDCRLEIHMNRNSQISIWYTHDDLVSMDIEPDFDGKQFKGIPIVIDNSLSDGEYKIVTKSIETVGDFYRNRFNRVV